MAKTFANNPWQVGDEVTALRLNETGDFGSHPDFTELESNVIDLIMQAYFDGKDISYQGLFFDGFAGGTKDGGSFKINFDTTEKRITMQNADEPFARDSSNTGNKNIDNTDPLSFAHGVPNKQNRLLIVLTTSNTGSGASSVTYNGVSLTLLSSVGYNSGVGEVWYMIAPPVGTFNIVVIPSGSHRIRAVSTNFVGADQAAPFGTLAQGSGVNNASVVVATVVGDIIYSAYFADRFDTGPNVGSGQTLHNNSGGGTAGIADSTELATGISDTQSFSTSGGVDTRLTAIPIHPSSTLYDGKTGAFYKSILTSFQAAKKKVQLWVTRKAYRFNLAASIASGATTLTISGDHTGKFANGNTIDIYNSANTVRERKTLTATPSFGSGVTTLTFTLAIVNVGGFDTNAFVERVDVLPQVSLVAAGGADSFQNMTHKRSEVAIPSAAPANSHALDLENSSSQYASAAHSASLNLGGKNVCIEFWVKKESDSNAWVTKAGVGTAQRAYELVWFGTTDGARLQFSGKFEGTYDSIQTASSSHPHDTGWHHVAGTYDGANLKLFFDGVLVATKAESRAFVDTGEPLRIGSNGDVNSFTDGLMDEVRIWRISRTDTQIKENYNKTLAADKAGLVAYYRLDNSYLDASGNGNTLTPVNSPAFAVTPAPTIPDTGQQAEGQIALDTAVSGSQDNVNGSGSQAITVGSGPNRIIVLFAMTDGAFGSADVDGNAMTQVGSGGTAGGGSVSIWYYLNPSVGAHTVNFNNARYMCWTVVSFFGVDQNTPFDALAAHGGGFNPGTYSVSPLGNAGDLIVGMIGNRTTGLGLTGVSAGGGQVGLGGAGTSINQQNSSYKPAVEGANTFSYSWNSPPASMYTGVIAVAMNAVTLKTIEIEDEYEYDSGAADKHDFKAKLNISRTDTALTVYAKRLGCALQQS